MTNQDALDASEGVAIIGMAGRFPGAPHLDAFWSNLCQGVESIATFKDETLAAAGVDPATLAHPNYIKRNPVVADIDRFDAAFFGYTPREAEIMDPQQRVFLECAWEALEQAGYDSERYPGRIGVYAGVGLNGYMLANLSRNREVLAAIDHMQLTIANDKDYLATRVSYKLNLKGPSINIQTACSTSLVAVHLACESLLNGECDLVLAGGVALIVPQETGYWYHPGGIVSPDGHCRAFDAGAAGTVFGSGMGVIVLKSLQDALQDGDHIHAVIKGSAINNDGSVKIGYTAPSVEGQADVIAAAHAMAGVHPEELSYIEAHGTGTTVGDPIEITALTRVFRAHTQREQFCGIGSVKTNIGHLDAAAGIAGLIKTVLALKHRQLPPTLHFERPNPKIDFASSPFYVNTSLAPWQATSSPRRAGVSSFGFGGTNAHVILEEAPMRPPSGPARPWQLLPLAARTPTALAAQSARLHAWLQQHPDASLADVAYTLQRGRRPFAHRRVLVCQSVAEAIAALAPDQADRLPTAVVTQQPPVAFLFPGQGSQHPGMAYGLYQHEPVFRDTLDRCCARLRPLLGYDLRPLLYPAPAALESATAALTETVNAQPALFVVEYALAQLWLSWGVQPDALLGHSLGEYVAATLAGVFTLEDALQLVAARGKLLHSLPPGAMLSVALPADALTPRLSAELALAARNTPDHSVVAGTHEAVAALEADLTAQGIEHRRLHTSHAFHSPLVEPILAPFQALVASVRLQPPQIPVVSNVTGTWLTAAEATDPAYWARQLRAPVAFAAGVATLLGQPERRLLEVGPSQSLRALVRQQVDPGAHGRVLAALPHPRDTQADLAVLLGSLGQLWLAGCPIRWERLAPDEQRQRLPLPTYPFERQRFWIEPSDQDLPAQRQQPRATRPDSVGFYLPAWEAQQPPRMIQPSALAERQPWLIFTDGGSLDTKLIAQLAADRQRVIRVVIGASFQRVDQDVYSINPQRSADYEALLAELATLDALPRTVLHRWNGSAAAVDATGGARAPGTGVTSILFLTRALAHAAAGRPVELVVVTSRAQDVTGAEHTAAEDAMIFGPCKVIHQEHPTITCRCIDIDAPAANARHETKLIGVLLAEIGGSDHDSIVAYRGNRRWVQTYKPLDLDRAQTEDGWRHNGVYLITNGTSQAGLALAEELLNALGARIVLLRSRDGSLHAPGRAEDSQHEEQTLSRVAAEGLVIDVEPGDEPALRAALAQAEARLGPIHGAIHLPGIMSNLALYRPITELRADELEPLAAVGRELHTLAQVLHGKELDFCLLFSSMTAITGGESCAVYAAASLLVDAFALQANKTSALPWCSINWEPWGAAEAQPELPGLPRAQALQAFRRVASRAELGQIVVSRGDTAEPASRVLSNGQPSHTQPLGSDTGTRAHPRPHLHTIFVAPGNEIEQAIATIWQDVLGIESVGVDDNFYELGGDSLLATQIINRIRTEFEIDVAYQELLDARTIAGLARTVTPLLQDDADMDILEMLALLSDEDADREITKRLGRGLDVHEQR